MLSIIIPTYNEEKYIRDAIGQFNGLKLPHEIIVTDDKSTDQTAAFAQAAAKAATLDGRSLIQVLVPESKHRTIAANRNDGARRATGDILVFMDGDSRIMDVNNFFQKAMERFEKHPEMVALTGIFGVLPQLATRADKIVYFVFNLVHRFKNNVIHVGEAPGKFMMIRHDAFKKVNGFREDLVSREDGDLFQRLAKIGRTYCDKGLPVFHHGRRSRKLGWPRLLWIWMFDAAHLALFDKVYSKDWKPVR